MIFSEINQEISDDCCQKTTWVIVSVSRLIDDDPDPY